MAQHSNANRIYFNVNIPYDENRPLDACVAEVRYDADEPVVRRGSDYYAAIVNFSLPVSSIPLMFVDPAPYPNTDIDITIYEVAIGFNGDVYKVPVIFIPTDTLAPKPNEPTANKPKIPRSQYYAVYTYNHFINMVNEAFDSAHSLASAPGDPPKLQLDPSTNLFELVVNETEYAQPDLTTPGTVQVYMNYELFQFFTGFNVTRTGFKSAEGTDFRFNVIVNNNVVDENVIISQDYSTISNWNTLRNLQLRAPGMATSDEFIPSTTSGSDQRTAKASILASFNPIYSNSPGNTVPRSQVSFTLESAYRLIDILTDNPLNKINLAVWWTDERNNEYRLLLNYRELIQIKMVFILKESFTG